MFQFLNNFWVMIFSVFLLYIIVNKIVYINEPFNEKKYIEQYINQEKIKKKINFNFFKQKLPDIAYYYLT